MKTLAQTIALLACFAWLATPAQAQITCDSGDPSTDIIVARNGGGPGPAQNTYNVVFCGSHGFVAWRIAVYRLESPILG